MLHIIPHKWILTLHKKKPLQLKQKHTPRREQTKKKKKPFNYTTHTRNSWKTRNETIPAEYLPNILGRWINREYYIRRLTMAENKIKIKKDEKFSDR